MSLDDRWGPWARKLCTVLLWCFGLGFVLSFALLLLGLIGDEASVRSFFARDGRLKVDNVPFDLAAIPGVGGLRWLLATFLILLLLAGAGVFLVLTRLRNLLDEVAYQKPFTLANAADLKLIGTMLLVGAFAVPCFKDAVQLVAGAVIPGHDVHLDLLPDLTLLLCGFLVRTLAVLFVRGARLQADADLTV